MILILFLTIVSLCVAKIVFVIRSNYLDWKAKRIAAQKICAVHGHKFYRVYAMDDPRLPVDICDRCKHQEHRIFPCPHCGVNIQGHVVMRPRSTYSQSTDNDVK